MKASDITKAIRKRFFAALERKTGWGREELKLEFEIAVSDALLDCLELELDNPPVTGRLLEK